MLAVVALRKIAHRYCAPAILGLQAARVWETDTAIKAFAR
jgi:hypothetical protein